MGRPTRGGRESSKGAEPLLVFLPVTLVAKGEDAGAGVVDPKPVVPHLKLGVLFRFVSLGLWSASEGVIIATGLVFNSNRGSDEPAELLCVAVDDVELVGMTSVVGVVNVEEGGVAGDS